MSRIKPGKRAHQIKVADTLWETARDMAAAEKLTMSALLVKALFEYVRKNDVDKFKELRATLPADYARTIRY